MKERGDGWAPGSQGQPMQQQYTRTIYFLQVNLLDTEKQLCILLTEIIVFVFFFNTIIISYSKWDILCAYEICLSLKDVRFPKR